MKNAICMAVALGTFAMIATGAFGQEDGSAGNIDDVIFNGKDPHKSPYKSTISLPVRSARIEPMVIRRGIDTFRYLLEIKDTSVVSLEIALPFQPTRYFLVHEGVRKSSLQFFDDGTHGDDVPDDHVFTINNLSIEGPDSAIRTTMVQTYSITFRHSDGRETVWNGITDTTFEGFGVVFSDIKPDLVPLRAVTQVSEDIQKTDYVVAMVIELPDDIADYFSSMDHSSIMERYYGHFADDRDFLAAQFAFALTFGQGHPAGTFRHIRSDIAGIGLPVSGGSSSPYSENLRGFISGYFPFVRETYMMGLNFGLLIHEINHLWSAYLDASLDLNVGAHWSTTLWRDYSAFDNDGFSFNDLELYLAGLISPDDVASPIGAGVNSIDEIIAIHGARVPDYTESQKDFTLTLLVVHDRPLTDVEMAYFDFVSREFEKTSSAFFDYSFSETTGGRATIATRLMPGTNEPPDVVDTIEEIQLLVGGDPFYEDLRSVFSDGNGDVLRFTAGSANETVATAIVTNSFLTVSAAGVGRSTITLLADDGRGGIASTSFEVSVPTGVSIEQIGDELPLNFALGQNYPNPFNSKTTVAFDLPRASRIALRVYDLLGREVAVLASGDFPAGRFENVWDATGHPSGIYVYRLEARNYTATKKLILHK